MNVSSFALSPSALPLLRSPADYWISADNGQQPFHQSITRNFVVCCANLSFCCSSWLISLLKHREKRQRSYSSFNVTASKAVPIFLTLQHSPFLLPYSPTPSFSHTQSHVITLLFVCAPCAGAPMIVSLTAVSCQISPTGKLRHPLPPPH